MPRLSCCLFLLVLLLPSAAPLLAEELRYPRRADGDEFRSSYMLAQLQLALDKAHSPLRLTPTPHPMEQERALLNLQRGEHLDVVWSMTSHEREQRLLPVRIPLDKGLFGWRIALLPAGQGQRLSQVYGLDDLRHFSAGQGHDWPDTHILRSHGLPVQVSSSYASLFHMLRAERFDYFPRALIEIWDELEQPRGQGLEVDPHVLLRYPTAMYFFFSPQRPDLAATVRLGLERALADGDFDRLFEQHFAAPLARSKLAQRRIIELHNPLLPAATPLAQRELWFSPQALSQAQAAQPSRH